MSNGVLKAGEEPVALFGTSADPPTRGHQALLEGLLRLYPQVATWASDNPQKHHGAPLEQRANLLGHLVTAIGDPRLSHKQELSSPWAITTLKRAATQWPGSELVFVVGSDLAAQVSAWKQAKALLKACVLAIAPRAGWPLEPKQLEQLTQLGGRVVILPIQVPATASSAVRQTPDPTQLPAVLLPLLLEHNLYGLENPSPKRP
ncbi:MAG: nicotinate-nucleotide adenylyltransferase [Cyanobacteria bacterium]|nr:nicotinate-nucleotide adenylyltransferase [Cyanobacteriota bacterium]MDA1246435.1 nicotinate-nucleotide adenylyltransferase [Cyanobacteriota bacterium]